MVYFIFSNSVPKHTTTLREKLLRKSYCMDIFPSIGCLYDFHIFVSFRAFWPKLSSLAGQPFRWCWFVLVHECMHVLYVANKSWYIIINHGNERANLICMKFVHNYMWNQALPFSLSRPKREHAPMQKPKHG